MLALTLELWRISLIQRLTGSGNRLSTRDSKRTLGGVVQPTLRRQVEQLVEPTAQGNTASSHGSTYVTKQGTFILCGLWRYRLGLTCPTIGLKDSLNRIASLLLATLVRIDDVIERSGRRRSGNATPLLGNGANTGHPSRRSFAQHRQGGIALVVRVELTKPTHFASSLSGAFEHFHLFDLRDVDRDLVLFDNFLCRYEIGLVAVHASVDELTA